MDDKVEPWPSDRFLSEISLGCGCLSLIGVGAPVVTDSKIVMWAFIVVGCAGLAAVIALQAIRYLRARSGQPLISLVIGKWRWTIVATTIAAIAAATAFWLQRDSAPQRDAPSSSLLGACVTDKEVAAQQAKGRQILTLAPSEIIDAELHGGSAASIYIGKWIKICSEFQLVMPKNDPDDPQHSYYVVWVYNLYGGTAVLNLYFDKERWESRLADIKDRQRFRAYCQIHDYDGKGWINAKNCELTD
jgi:hypothetical protein